MRGCKFRHWRRGECACVWGRREAGRNACRVQVLKEAMRRKEQKGLRVHKCQNQEPVAGRQGGGQASTQSQKALCAQSALSRNEIGSLSTSPRGQGPGRDTGLPTLSISGRVIKHVFWAFLLLSPAAEEILAALSRPFSPQCILDLGPGGLSAESAWSSASQAPDRQIPQQGLPGGGSWYWCCGEKPGESGGKWGREEKGAVAEAESFS